MDEQQQLELQRQKQLEAERQKLTEPQRAHLGDVCASLKEDGNYKTEYALKAANLIRTESGIRLEHGIQRLHQEAERQGLIDQRAAFAEADKQKALQAQQAAQEKNERDKVAAQDRQAREAKTLAAQQEPVPFEDIIAASKALREAEAARASSSFLGPPRNWAAPRRMKRQPPHGLRKRKALIASAIRMGVMTRFVVARHHWKTGEGRNH